MTTRLCLMMFVVTVSGCGDGLDRYEGTWGSGFGDQDAYGQRASTAYRLKIDDNRRFQFAYRRGRDEAWRDGSSGTITSTTVDYNGSPSDGIDLGTSYAVLGGSKLHVMIDGTIADVPSQRASVGLHDDRRRRGDRDLVGRLAAGTLDQLTLFLLS